MTATDKTSARVQLSLIALVFFGPLLVATVMYYGGYLQPQGRTNHGALMSPVISLVETVPDLALPESVAGRWLLIYTHNGDCAPACRRALYTMRQSRRMLGKETPRLERVFLHDDSPLDTVFLADEHAGLIALQNRPLSTLLQSRKPASLQTGGYFLLDPHRNLVMYFGPAIDPAAMVEDIQHLLKYSRIG
jgi:hypothetical protein